SYALEHALRELAQLQAADIRQTYLLQHFLNFVAALLGRNSREPSVLLEKFARIQVVVKLWLLRMEANLCFDCRIVDFPVHHASRTTRLKNQPHKELQRRRFAGAIWP